MAARVIDGNGLQGLIEGLVGQGYEVLGPTVRDEAIVYDRIGGADDLPRGWTDRQEPARYRIERRDDDAFFGFNVGSHSWKQFLHPPVERMWAVERGEHGMKVTAGEGAPQKYAFVGVRACEIAAIAVQDRVFRDGSYPDVGYARRREKAFIVAVNCGQAGGTCFCVSMETGPRAKNGYDLALTELIDGQRHEFLVEAGSDAGAALLEGLSSRAAGDADIAAGDAAVANAAGQMGRHLDTDGIKGLLQANPDHPRWDDVAERCLTCGNCTMVCPTCFCTTVQDHSDLTGQTAERTRSWDSCFTMDFSYIHGGSVRTSNKARYRQWMTHKLASWFDQFGTSGCVGCGRCVTWCPVGIDITEEAAAIRATPDAGKGAAHGGS
jgi:sulfhydrogenase subunit beta (sulfur reductase)